MDQHTMVEQAYKNGYAKGFEAGKKAAVVHGRWILHEEGKVWKRTYYTCSNCGSRNPLHKFNYCFNCGAKMDLEVNNG